MIRAIQRQLFAPFFQSLPETNGRSVDAVVKGYEMVIGALQMMTRAAPDNEDSKVFLEYVSDMAHMAELCPFCEEFYLTAYAEVAGTGAEPLS